MSAKPRQTAPAADPKRANLLAALAAMPDEAFGWFVLACYPHAGLTGAKAQIWPDGLGGFSAESRESIEAVRAAADVYLKG